MSAKVHALLREAAGRWPLKLERSRESPASRTNLRFKRRYWTNPQFTQCFESSTSGYITPCLQRGQALSRTLKWPPIPGRLWLEREYAPGQDETDSVLMPRSLCSWTRRSRGRVLKSPSSKNAGCRPGLRVEGSMFETTAMRPLGSSVGCIVSYLPCACSRLPAGDSPCDVLNHAPVGAIA